VSNEYINSDEAIMYPVLYLRCNFLIILFVKMCHVEYRKLVQTIVLLDTMIYINLV
jgi:hypothetical protein